MKIDVNRVVSWSTEVDDRPGALAEKLNQLSQAGANLEFVISRRSHENPGKDVVFVTPITGAAQTRAAKAAGFAKAESLHELKVECPDKAGIGAKLLSQIAEAGINVRGIAGGAIGRKLVAHFSFESKEDANKAMRILKKNADKL